MKSHAPLLRRVFDRIQRRFIRSRPGSVLILVVALLVLMALIGTAYVTMAQNDRAASGTHALNTEMDLLMEGLQNLVSSTLVGDIMINGQYRPTVPTYDAGNGDYSHYTGVGPDVSATIAETPTVGPGPNQGDAWLADRLPTVANPINIGLQQAPFWRFITGPLTGQFFESPQWPSGASQPWIFTRDVPPQPIGPFAAVPKALGGGQTAVWVPTFTPVNGTNYPAFAMGWLNPTTGVLTTFPNNNNPTRVLAADADGDGIADSCLFKLPVGTVNGITYYAAVRIIDNAAAINANTAWQNNIAPWTTASVPQLPGNFFPTNVDLVSVLDNPMTEIMQLNNYRFRSNGYQSFPLLQLLPTIPVNDAFGNQAATRRQDFAFQSASEVAWMQLGRRIQNPGLLGATSGALTQIQPLSISESVAMAYKFCLMNPYSSPSILETALPWSTYSNNFYLSRHVGPYDPSDALNWYQNNFRFNWSISPYQTAPLPAQSQTPLRSVLVARNGVSNFVPNKFRDRGYWKQGTVPAYMLGDSVLYQAPNTTTPHRYVCINPLRGGIVPPVSVTTNGLYGYDSDTWVYMPWTNAPTKANVNTASFGQLFLAYWSVMAEQQAPFNGQPIWEPEFTNNQPWPHATIPSPPKGVLPSPRMFRNPVRMPPTLVASTSLKTAGTLLPAEKLDAIVGLTPAQVMQLRAALAAVNTMDLRDNDDDVTSKQVVLVDPWNPVQDLQQVTATVYGMERQPVITEVYATNAPVTSGGTGGTGGTTTNGYVAIELYNPDPVRPITLKNWVLATVSRPDTVLAADEYLPNFGDGSNNLLIKPLAYDPGEAWDGGTANTTPTIPPNGYIVIASSEIPPTGVQLPADVMVATPGTPTFGGMVPLYIVHGLSSVIAGSTGTVGTPQQELILFRPRLDKGLLTSQGFNASGSPASQFPQYNEGSAKNPWPTNLKPYDMVPVDEYDFTGLRAPANASEQPTEWHYVRPSAPASGSGATATVSKVWHFIYPGHYTVPGTLAPSSTGGGGTGGTGVGATTPDSTSGPPRFYDGTVYWTGPPGGTFPPPPSPVGGGGGKDTFLWSLGIADQTPIGLPVPGGTSTPNPAYHDVPLQLNNVDFAGPNNPLHPRNAAGTAEANAFPFGGFARNGDILQVPFVGAYRLMFFNNTSHKWQVFEINSATVDSVMALAAAQPKLGEMPPDPVNGPGAPTAATGGTGATGVGGGPSASLGGEPIMDALTAPWPNPNAHCVENIGRFCPISALDIAPGGSAQQIDDFSPPLTTSVGVPPSNPLWRYHFATRLFDYLTVQSPQQDFLPEVDPSWDPASNQWKYPPTNVNAKKYAPEELANATPGVANSDPANLNGSTEETIPVDGLVNINTAPYRVLMTLPWLLPTSPPPGTVRQQTLTSIAYSIVRYRDIDDGTGANPPHGHGPFKSIFELNQVPYYDIAIGRIVPNKYLRDMFMYPTGSVTTADPGPALGDLSPLYTGQTDGVISDFETRYLMINRVSNLITTRSDSYTAYILVQGWRDAETANPTLVVQRRAAVILDRSAVTPQNRTPSVTNVPTD